MENKLAYSQINSDGDILDFKYESLYIKPHGTVSEPNTLRFQRSDYYKLENETQKLLELSFSEKSINLIVMGFRLKFHEFSTLIHKWMPKGSRIFIFDKINLDI